MSTTPAKPPEILDKIVDLVLSYKPKLKKNSTSSPKPAEKSENNKHKANKKGRKSR
jgi:hypothetical protein